MTLSDPNPSFKVTVYLQVEYLKNCAFLGQSFYRTLIGNHTWCKRVARVCQRQLSFLLWSALLVMGLLWCSFNGSL